MRLCVLELPFSFLFMCVCWKTVVGRRFLQGRFNPTKTPTKWGVKSVNLLNSWYIPRDKKTFEPL